MPQPLWHIESPENLSQIVPKGRRSNESYVAENASREKGRPSVPKDVGSETKAKHDARFTEALAIAPVCEDRRYHRKLSGNKEP